LFNSSKTEFDLNEAIDIATDYIIENDVPACDYTLSELPPAVSLGIQPKLTSRALTSGNTTGPPTAHGSMYPSRSNIGRNKSALKSAVEKFRNAVRKAKVLSKKSQRMTLMDITQ
jgi:hypothetical protein